MRRYRQPTPVTRQPMTSNQPEVSSSSNSAHDPESGGQMTFFEHLIELRKRIINALVAIILGALIGWVIAPRVVNIITVPIQGALNAHKLNPQLVYTGPTDYLSLLIKLSIYIGSVLASPIDLYQVWQFVAPPLYKDEKSAVTSYL